MNISYNWIKSKLNNFNPSIKELNHCFNSLGFEVESIKNYKDNKNLLIAKIISFEKVENSDHLNFCILEDLNKNRYEVICGANNLKKDYFVYYAPVGSTIYNGLTLSSKVLKGITSEGMICSLEEIGVNKEFLNESEKEGIIIIDPINIDLNKDNNENIKSLGLDDVIFDISITFNREECYAIHNLLIEIAFFFKTSLKIREINKYNKLFIKHNIKKELFDFLNIYLLKNNNKNKIDFKDYFWAKQYKTPNLNAFNFYDFLKIKNRIEYGLNILAIPEPDLESIKFNIDSKNNYLLIENKNNKYIYNGAKDFEANLEESENVYIILFKLKNQYISKEIEDIHYNKTLFKNIYLNNYNNIITNNSFISYENIVPLSIMKKSINFNLNECYKLLGYKLEDKNFFSTLKKINFDFIQKNDSYKAIIPINRQDIFSSSCLLEEYLRLNGYDNIKLKPYQIKPYNINLNYLDSIHYYLIGKGYNNIKTYNLTSEAYYNFFNFNELDKIKISNPISSNYCIMQPNILSSAFNVFAYNNKNKILNCNFYEIKDVYKSLRQKCKHLFIGNQNNIIHHVKNNQKINADFYYVKNTILNILNTYFNINDNEIDFKPIHKNKDIKLHIYQTFHIYYQNINIGLIGSIDPKFIKENKMQNFIFSEICLDKIKITNVKKYKQKNEYINNNIIKDITYYKNNSNFKEIVNLLNKNSLIIDFYIKDFYDNNKNPKITLSIIFNSQNVILNNNLINDAIDNIKQEFNKIGIKIDD